MDRSAEGEATRTVAVYVDSNLDTRFVFEATGGQTFAEVQHILKGHHQYYFPRIGEVAVHDLMVEANSAEYLVLGCTQVGTVFTGKQGFMKLYLEKLGGTESGVALAFNSELLPNETHVEVGPSERAECALTANAHGTVSGLRTLELMPDYVAKNTSNIISLVEDAVVLQDASLALRADKGKAKVDDEVPVDIPQVACKGKVESELGGISDCGQKVLADIQQQNALVSFRSKDNISSPIVQFHVAGEDSVLNVSNVHGVAALAKNSSKSECQKSEKRSDKMFLEADLITRSSLINVDDPSFQNGESRELNVKQNVLSPEIERNALVLRLESSDVETKDGLSLGEGGSRELAVPDQSNVSRVNESSHSFDLNVHIGGNELKVKKKVSHGIKIRLDRIRHKTDRLEILPDPKRRIDEMPEHVKKTSLPTKSEDALLHDPLSNSDALNTGSEGTKKKKRKTLGSMELESRQSPLKKAVSLEKSVHPGETSGSLNKSLEANANESKFKMPKQHSSFIGSGGKQVQMKKSFQGNEGIKINSHQLSADALDNSTHSDLDGKDSTPNRSTDVEMDDMIVSLLSFQDAKPASSKDHELSMRSMSTSSLKKRETLKHLAPSGDGSSKDVPEVRDMFTNCSTENSFRLKSKKRKLLAEDTKNESGLSANLRHQGFEIANDLEHAFDMSDGKCEKYGDLKQADDSRKGKKVKFHQSKSSRSEILEPLHQSEHESVGKKYQSAIKDGLDQIENRPESLPEMAVEGGDIHARKLKKTKKVKISGEPELEKTEHKEDGDNAEIVHQQASLLLNKNRDHCGKAENLNKQNDNSLIHSLEKIPRNHGKKYNADLTAGKFGTRSAHVHEKAEAAVMSKDLVPFIVPSPRKHKENKKSNVVDETAEQGKPNTDSISKTERKDNNVTVVGPAALVFEEIGVDSRHHGNGNGVAPNKIESNTKKSSGKRRLIRKRDLDKVSEDAVNRVFQDEMLFLQNNVFPTEHMKLDLSSPMEHTNLQPSSPTDRTVHDLRRTKDDVLLKPSKLTGAKLLPPRPARSKFNQGEKSVRLRPPRIRPKFESPCPAGCGKIYSGKTSAWYQHRKTCKGL